MRKQRLTLIRVLPTPNSYKCIEYPDTYNSLTVYSVDTFKKIHALRQSISLMRRAKVNPRLYRQATEIVHSYRDAVKTNRGISYTLHNSNNGGTGTLNVSTPYLTPNLRKTLFERYKVDVRARRLENKPEEINPGRILGLYKGKKRKSILTYQSPDSAQRHVAVELEFCSPISMEDLADVFIEEGCSQGLTVKSDGSIRVNLDSEDNEFEPEEGDDNHGYPIEIALCGPVHGFKERLERVLKIVNGKGAWVNKTCGFHVHLDARASRDQASQMACNLFKAQDLLYAMNPKTRKDNSYCVPAPLKGPKQALAQPSTRYRGVNVESYRKHGTIEVRIHAGTTNYAKICKWIDLLSQIAYGKFTRFPRHKSKLGRIVESFTLRRYVETRIEQFLDQHGPNSFGAKFLGTAKALTAEDLGSVPSIVAQLRVQPLAPISASDYTELQTVTAEAIPF